MSIKRNIDGNWWVPAVEYDVVCKRLAELEERIADDKSMYEINDDLLKRNAELEDVVHRERERRHEERLRAEQADAKVKELKANNKALQDVANAQLEEIAELEKQLDDAKKNWVLRARSLHENLDKAKAKVTELEAWKGDINDAKKRMSRKDLAHDLVHTQGSLEIVRIQRDQYEKAWAKEKAKVAKLAKVDESKQELLTHQADQIRGMARGLENSKAKVMELEAQKE